MQYKIGLEAIFPELIIFGHFSILTDFLGFLVTSIPLTFLSYEILHCELHAIK